MIQKIDVKKKQSIVEEIIREFDNEFNPPLNTVIADFREYAKKISKYGNCIVAEENHECVGFALFYSNNSPIAYITLIAVKSIYSGKHIGKDMIDYIKNYILVDDCNQIQLAVNKDNIAAISFYKSNGFEFMDKETDKQFFLSWGK